MNTSKLKKYRLNRGMTYVELIVVLSIFAVMTSVVLFNYGGFQAKIDIKNLASDMALKIVEAQKSSLSGKLAPLAQQALIANPSTWKPAYGTYFGISENNSFIYYVDLDQNDGFTDITCPYGGECLEKVMITKGNTISRLDVFYQGDATPHPLTNLTVNFKRPNSGATLKSATGFTGVISYVQITVVSPKSPTALIKVYPSGRIQIN